MAVHVVVGKGPIGTATARLLVDAGHHVRVVSRSGGSPVPGVEAVMADAADARALADAARGAAALYNCVNPAYPRWATDWPPVAAALLQAAEETGAVLTTMSNLYVYGPVDAPMTEATPLAATGTKGRVRVAMWREALARHQAGRLRAVELRASDFVGPEVGLNGHLGERVVPQLLAGRTAWVLGEPDAPHSWTAVRDVARALVTAAQDERAWGRAWHVPTDAPVSIRTALGEMAALGGVRQVPVRRYPRGTLRLGGMVSPLLRELREVEHQFTKPFVLDSTPLAATFGMTPTPLADSLAATVACWQPTVVSPTAVVR